MNTTKKEWLGHQDFEKKWWANCVNTYREEEKQWYYASKMGLEKIDADGKFSIDVHNQSILDIGGGPVSLLLKTINLSFGMVIEPMKMPGWVLYRYLSANINVATMPAENIKPGDVYDEVWIYNVLQHTMNPKKIIKNAVASGKLVRIFEWLNTPPHEGHPQTLRADKLDKWLGGKGRVAELDREEWGGFHTAYYGVFSTKHYKGSLNM